MDEPEDVLELERKIAQASRIAQYVPDPTTYERLKAWVEELRQRLLQRRAVRRNREEITEPPPNEWTPVVGFLSPEVSNGRQRRSFTEEYKRQAAELVGRAVARSGRLPRSSACATRCCDAG